MSGLSRARRWRRPGVRPLEVWNLPVPGGELWQRLGAARIEEMAGSEAGAVDLSLAEALVDAVTVARRRWTFGAVAVGGGLLARPGLAAAVASAAVGCPLTILPGGRFASEPGGLALLEESDFAGGMVVDVGQTSIKGSCRGRRFVRKRDVKTLPRLLIGMPKPQGADMTALVAHAADFVAGFIRELREAARPSSPGLILALPCPIDDALLPGACTYGWEGAADLVPRILAGAGPPLDVRVVNDAELLAESALRRGVRRPALCLSLGFGPGGALLEPGE